MRGEAHALGRSKPDEIEVAGVFSSLCDADDLESSLVEPTLPGFSALALKREAATAHATSAEDSPVIWGGQRPVSSVNL